MAAAISLRKAGVIGREDIVVCNLTGHGLKQPEAIRIPESELQPIAPTLDALREYLRKSNG
jgi:threonine synthase